MPSTKPVRDLGEMILTLRGQRVNWDSDLAELYQIPTKILNQAVRRNSERLPREFAFIVTRQEVVSGGRRYAPRAFTKHGVLMAANVLHSPRAIAISVALTKAFVRVREVLATHEGLAKRLTTTEKTLLTRDAALRDIYQRIQPLLLPPADPPRKKIGF